MNKYVTCFMLFSCLGILSCQSRQHHLSVESFAQSLRPESVILDVRTPEEYAEGHLRGAVNVNCYDDCFLEKVQERFPGNEPLYVYCRSGRRSTAVADRLSRQGYTVYNMLGGYLAWTEAGMDVSRYEVERFVTPTGQAVEITLIKHASLEIRFRGMSIQVDPVKNLGKPTDYAADFPKADYILVTHEHGDHFDPELLGEIRKEGTTCLTNARCAAMLGWGSALSNGEHWEGAFQVDAVPAYNTTEGRLQFHPKGRDNGYVLDLEGLRIYIAGDTEDIPEMAALKDIDIAFLPCNQPYTMTPEQCVRAAQTIKPKILIPYHFGQTEMSGLPELLPQMEVRLRQMQ